MLPKEIEAQIHVINAATVVYCNKSLDRSRFFTLFKDGTMTLSIMQYAFLQYYHWRDRLHQWFGLCMVKAGSCTELDQKMAVMSLADHTFTDLQDGHDEMYLEFLYDLELSEVDIQTSQRSVATTSYERSFFDDFGYETDNFYEALAGLSGRELCVSIRNQRILQYYFDAHNLKRPIWLALHAELETDHFLDVIRPALNHYAGDSAKIAELMKALEHSIDRHVQYFEEMLHEYESQA
jgi:thiaminase